MGNIRLLLSVAYGFGVLGPDWTRDLETAWARFFPPSSPPSLSSSSSSSSSCFSRPGWGCSFGTSVKGRRSQIIPGNKRVFLTWRGAKADLCSRAQHGHWNSSRLQISEKKHSWSFQGWLETAKLVKQVCVCLGKHQFNKWLLICATLAFHYSRTFTHEDTWNGLQTMSRIFCSDSVLFCKRKNQNWGIWTHAAQFVVLREFLCFTCRCWASEAQSSSSITHKRGEFWVHLEQPPNEEVQRACDSLPCSTCGLTF